MDKNHFDICIVGQGIAGTLLGHFLESYGYKVLIIDNHHQHASSMVAAGIVNPITGRRFVKSWRIDDFLPAALEVYNEVATKLSIRPYTLSNVIRTLETTNDENNWLSRTTDALYEHYIVEDADTSEFEGFVNTPLAYGEISGAFHVHFANILKGYRDYWDAQGAYLDAYLNYDDLIILDNAFRYKDFKFEKIVFCEGFQGKSNPYFEKLNIQPAKGEVLFVRIEGAKFKKIYKDNIFLVHQYDDVYWVGSGYEWDFESDAPTENARVIIESELQRILKVPYQVVDHIAGVRPSTGNRRPLMRHHEQYPGMYLFNGLGTKGASLAPFFARQFARYIAEGNPEDLSY